LLPCQATSGEVELTAAPRSFEWVRVEFQELALLRSVWLAMATLLLSVESLPPMALVDLLWILHQALAVVLIYLFTGIVVRLAMQARSRRLKTAKPLPTVGYDHNDLGRWHAAARNPFQSWRTVDCEGTWLVACVCSDHLIWCSWPGSSAASFAIV